MKRKGMILVAILGTIAILTIVGLTAAYFVLKGTKNAISTKRGILLTRTAQSGVEVALAWLKNTETVTLPKTFTGEVNNMSYNATLSLLSDGGIQVVSIAKDKFGNEKKVVVVINTGKVFFPFAINGDFQLGEFSTSGRWNSADTGVQTLSISDNVVDVMRREGFNIAILPQIDLPKAADFNVDSYYPSESECDYGNYSQNTFINDLNLYDKNGDGQIVVCGFDIAFERTLTKFPKNTIVAAQHNIVFDTGATLKRDLTGNALSLTILSKGVTYFDANSQIDFAGADEGYNIMIYSGGGIISPDDNGQWISISGNQDTDYVSNVVIITPEKVEVNRDIIDETATTKNDVNFIFWADKGLFTEGGFDIAGSNSKTDAVRHFSVIVANGDASFGRWQFSGSYNRAGLTYNDIENYCYNGKSLGIPENVVNFYCEIKKQIDLKSKEFEIREWREY